MLISHKSEITKLKVINVKTIIKLNVMHTKQNGQLIKQMKTPYSQIPFAYTILVCSKVLI